MITRMLVLLVLFLAWGCGDNKQSESSDGSLDTDVDTDVDSDTDTDADTDADTDSDSDSDSDSDFSPDSFTTEVVYLNQFEDGDLEPDVGAGWNNSTYDQGGTIVTVSNPSPDAVNGSDTVARFSVDNPDDTGIYKVRAEMYGGRFPTEGMTYHYSWSVFIPNDFFDGATFHNVDASTNYWLALTQWSTWPCEVCNNERYGSRICGGCGGIFNDATVNEDKELSFRWRAEPHCYDEAVTLPLGRWVRHEMVTYWTMDNTGYSYLWQDGVLIRKLENVKTLFDSWETEGHDDDGNELGSSCEMIWAVGIYSKWGGTKDEVFLYIDDVEIAEVR